MSGELRSVLANGVLSLVIDNEARANAMSQQMTKALGRELDRADQDDEVRVVLITGAGDRVFCSGHDITELLENPTAAFDAAANEVFQRPRLLRKPTIAAINGAAYAGGLNLALACDIRIGSAAASFAATGARLALLPIGGQLSVLPTLIGVGPAMDMLLRSRPVNADRAFALGLLSQVVDPAQLHAVAAEAATFLASTPVDLNSAIKRAVWSSLEDAGRPARQVEIFESETFGRGSEAQRRLSAFLAKASHR
ncbi:enoyl-CoA hydratase/isomerase family protein [Paenarthrobacter ureafaciens]|uniref:enoyl-CoA hydratase/isomerase family protein n=1 Tax=Paenarthrobacter ureafaciens TaxID=37931 RepID=UPI0019171E4F|nr:enoyl-CoA hydratase/isomerase family protein [Paenarthrobacter ureafaciens]QQQ64394.1 enoyl-CoA hydratase/isomerase family protein [Paenarthrobacter ureafaciens]